MNPANPEIGRELTVSELTEKTVYVLCGDHRPGYAITMWCTGRGDDWALFLAGEIDMALAVKANERGEMFDGLGRRIRVYEFLGKAEDHNAN